MKKSLLFSLALGFAFCATAQTQRNYSDVVKLENPWKSNKIAESALNSNLGPVKPINNSVKGVNSVFKTDIGSSTNAYTAIVEQSHCLYSDPATGLISFIHRGGGTLTGSTGNDIFSAYSVDGGTTWDRLMINPTNGKSNRYPSGAIYNPAGNTNPLNAYLVFSGPVTTPDWTENYLGSIRVDSTNASVENILNETTPTLHDNLMRNGMEASSNGKVHVWTSDYTLDAGNTYFTEYNGLDIRNGVFNATTNKFDWTQVKQPIALLQGGTNNEFMYGSDGSAWSEDGLTGYIYVNGIEAGSTDYSYQPIIMKTTDAGLTWTKLAHYDFRGIQVVMDSVWPQDPNDPATVSPFFTGTNDAVVDNQGYLHLICNVQGHSSADLDSLGYTYTGEPIRVFHFWQTATGWEGKYVTTIKAGYVPAESSGFGSGTDAMGWGSRLQASRTADGTKVFAVWSDTPSEATNIYPDIFAWGTDLSTGLETPAKNFTTGSLYEAENGFHYTAPRTMVSGSDFSIPVTTMLKGGTPIDAVTHQYLSGVTFNQSEFVGIKEVKNNNFTIGQNYPNPANGSTNVDINLTKSANINVVVTNLMGQVVNQINLGQVAAGKAIAKINTTSLNAGVYFYTVNIDNASYTGKMIVE